MGTKVSGGGRKKEKDGEERGAPLRIEQEF